jgi:hypothetical protein
LGWRNLIIGTAAAALLLFSLFLSPSDPDVWFVFVVIPCVALLVLVLLVLLILRHTRRRSAELLLITFAFMVIAMVGIHFESTLRPRLRWAFFSHKFKTEVLSQPSDSSGDFKHVEWDGSGGAPVGDWTTYVVFDPTGSLRTEAGRRNPGKIPGIPCDVQSIQRLEPRWYSVTLQVNEWWERCRKEVNAQGSE